MSENFRGVTFAEQGVTPADDAIVRRAILPDGILTGCEISYSGSTLTMAAGYIIACGRTFQHIAAQNWAVVDATSGFARLVLTIDLTKTATEATFNQIESSIEYAAAEDGFVDLEQSDINLSGTRYQIAAAVVSLGTGGITGIVFQLALSRVEGGGGLNFSVVDGLTQPGDPKENMIWVYAEGMTGWYMAAEQPEGMQPGEVWISTGVSSYVAFNALKKNTVMVYPLSAKQMQADGTLVDVPAKSWQNGQWVDWWGGSLYDSGNEYASITGGWEKYASTYSDVFEKNADHMRILGATVGTARPINLTGKTNIRASIYTNSATAGTKLGLKKTKTGDFVASVDIPRGSTYADEDVTLPISLEGEYYVCIYNGFTQDSTYTKKVYLE